MLKILKLHNLKFEYFSMTKIQYKAYQNNLHNTSFPKSPKSLNLDKLVKRYKGYGGRDLAEKGRDLIEEARDLSVMAKRT